MQAGSPGCWKRAVLIDGLTAVHSRDQMLGILCATLLACCQLAIVCSVLPNVCNLFIGVL